MLDIGPLECSSCGGRMRFVDVIEDVGRARSELRRRNLPSRSVAPNAASSSPQGGVPAPNADFLHGLALLARVERAIRASEPELALTLLAELERRHPRSSLVEERAAARLLAGCLRGDSTARARAERFVREHAASVYVERVRRSCRVGAAASQAADPPRGGRAGTR
jgi:hypothetical protein